MDLMKKFIYPRGFKRYFAVYFSIFHFKIEQFARLQKKKHQGVINELFMGYIINQFERVIHERVIHGS